MMSWSACLQRSATDKLGPPVSARPVVSYTISRDIIIVFRRVGVDTDGRRPVTEVLSLIVIRKFMQEAKRARCGLVSTWPSEQLEGGGVRTTRTGQIRSMVVRANWNPQSDGPTYNSASHWR